MFVLPLALCALSVTGEIAIHVEEAGELEREKSFELAEAIARAIEVHTATRVRVEDPAWWGCPEDSEDRCAGEIRARTGASELVLLRIYAGLRSIRVIADRLPQAKATIDLVRTSTAWSGSLAPLAVRLFPEGAINRSKEPPLVEPPTPSPPKVAAPKGSLPWIVLGAGAAAAIAGAFFLEGNFDARSELEGNVRSHVRSEDLRSTQTRDGILAISLFGVAAGGVFTGVWMLSAD